jgi:hypothetical protein
MSFALFPIEIVRNIFSFMSPIGYRFINDSNEFRKKLPYIARKEFLENIHPLYVYLWKVSDYYIPLSNKNETLIHRSIIKGAPNDQIIYLVEKGFRKSAYDLEPIFKSENFELMKYYYQIQVLTNINLEPITFFIEKGRLDIIEWICARFEKQAKSYKTSMMYHAIINNQLEICDFIITIGFSLNLFLASPITRVIPEYLLNSRIIKNETLDWLWSKGMRWTIEEAREIGNEHMFVLSTSLG